MSEIERIEKFKELMKGVVPLDVVTALHDKGFFTAPASTKYHGNYEGGLFDHSYAVTKTLCELTVCNNLRWEKDRSPLLIGMFHDLCKIDSYKRPDVLDYGEDRWEFNNNTLLNGHGDKSVMLLSEFFQLTMEEILCIRYHMGAFTEKDEWGRYTKAVNNYVNVLWTHHADMLASHVYGI